MAHPERQWYSPQNQKHPIFLSGRAAVSARLHENTGRPCEPSEPGMAGNPLTVRIIRNRSHCSCPGHITVTGAIRTPPSATFNVADDLTVHWQRSRTFSLVVLHLSGYRVNQNVDCVIHNVTIYSYLYLCALLDSQLPAQFALMRH